MCQSVQCVDGSHTGLACMHRSFELCITLAASCRYYRPAVYKQLESHRRRQLANQASAIKEAQCTTEKVIAEKLGPEGISVTVRGTVRSVFSMYKAVQNQISSKLAGTPMEDVPDAEVCIPVEYCSCHAPFNVSDWSAKWR